MKINEHFKDFIFDYNTYLSILYGGAGSSKSYSITQKLIIKALTMPIRALVYRKTGVTLNDSVVALFKSVLDKEGIPYTYRAFDRTLFLGESVILFRCIDDPERIKSVSGITDIWLEEATEFNPEDFQQLVLRLREPGVKLQYIISFNPVAKTSWVWRFFFDPDADDYFLDGINYMIDKSTYKDNAFLPPEYIQRLLSLKKSNYNYFCIYALGEWGSLGKLIFPYGSYTIEELDIPVGAKYIDGLDLGWNDPNGLACSAVWRRSLPNKEKEDILYTYKTWSKSECTADEITAVLKSYCKNRTVYGDNAAAAQIKEIQKKGVYNLVPNTKLPGSVLSDINTIKCFTWYIHPDCKDLIRELGIYQWKKDKVSGLYLEEPERGSGDSHVNVIDGVRYSLQGLGSNIRTVNVKLPKGL